MLTIRNNQDIIVMTVRKPFNALQQPTSQPVRLADPGKLHLIISPPRWFLFPPCPPYCIILCHPLLTVSTPCLNVFFIESIKGIPTLLLFITVLFRSSYNIGHILVLGNNISLGNCQDYLRTLQLCVGFELNFAGRRRRYD